MYLGIDISIWVYLRVSWYIDCFSTSVLVLHKSTITDHPDRTYYLWIARLVSLYRWHPGISMCEFTSINERVIVWLLIICWRVSVSLPKLLSCWLAVSSSLFIWRQSESRFYLSLIFLRKEYSNRLFFFSVFDSANILIRFDRHFSLASTAETLTHPDFTGLFCQFIKTRKHQS